MMDNEATYVRWLEQEREKDELERKCGLSPLPRSSEERMAIFYTLPIWERRRLSRMKDFAKEQARK